MVAHARAGNRVLVVDKNQTSRRLMAFLLGDDGYTAVPADGLEAARSVLQEKSNPVHLVLLDSDSAGFDWKVLAREL